MASSKIGMSYIAEGQQGNDVTFSDNVNILDGVIQISVINQTTSAPPTPSNGHAYIVASGGTGDFAGKDGQYAYYQDQWYFYTAEEGWLMYDKNELNFYFYDGAAWNVLIAGGGGGDFLALTNKVYASLNSGVVEDLAITINANPALFDVAAGVGVVLDHTVEATPVWTRVVFAGLTGVTLTNLATAVFTRIYLESNGTLRQVPDDQGGPSDRRDSIQLQLIVHSDHATIASISSDSMPAYNNIQNIIDMLTEIGPVSKGLSITANGANLNIDRALGTFSRLFVDRLNSPGAPNTISIAADTATTFIHSHRNGAGGFNFVGGFVSLIDPDIYDDDTASPGTVGAGQWQIMRPYFFAQAGSGQNINMALGQNLYASKGEALSAIETESFEASPEFKFATNNTRIVIKQGATDLTDLEQCVFVDFQGQTALLSGSSVLEMQELLSAMELSGFDHWHDAGDYYTIVGGNTFRLDRGGLGWIKGSSVSWIGGQTPIALTQWFTNYVYIDNTGTIGSTTSATHATYTDNIVLFEAYYDGGVIVVRDNHPVELPTATSGYLHNVIGSVLDANGAVIERVATGAGASPDDRQIKMVGEGMLYDHGISEVIPDSGGLAIAGNTFYLDVSSHWVIYASLATELDMVWNNAGVPELGGTAANTGFMIQAIYVSKSDLNVALPSYYAILDNAQYSSLSNAQAAINTGNFQQATGELARLELVQLGYLILKNNVAGGYVAEVQVAKAVLNAQAIAQQGNSASQISADVANFDGMLSATDTPVQAALETIDEFGKSTGFQIKDGADLTKIFDLIVSNIATATTRTMTIGDAPINFVNTTEDYVMTWTLAGGWAAAAAPGAGGGESNTASNTGTTGLGLFKQKSVADLEFYKINSVNNAITFALDGTDKIDMTFVAGNVLHSALGGLTNHTVDTPGTPGVTTQYVYQITDAGVKSWQEYIAGGGGGLTTEVKIADFTVASGKRYIVDSASVIVATLPATWSVGDEFIIVSIQSDVDINSGATSQKMYQYPDESLTSAGSNEKLMTTLANRSSHWVADTTLRFYEMEQAERASVAVVSSGKGYAAGGFDGGATGIDDIQGVIYSSEASFVSSAVLESPGTGTASSCRSRLKGYVLGGQSYSSNVQGLVFITDTLFTSATALLENSYHSAGFSSDIKGYVVGGLFDGLSLSGITFSSDAVFNIGSVMTQTVTKAAGFESSNKGYIAGGGATTVDKIQSVDFLDESTEIITAVMSDARDDAGACASSTKGYVMGGDAGFVSDRIDGIVFSTEGAFTVSAGLSAPRVNGEGASSNSKGYIMGGHSGTGTSTVTNTLQNMEFVSEATSTLGATLATAFQSACAFESPDDPPATTIYGADYSTTDVSEFGGITLTTEETTSQKALVKLDEAVDALGVFGGNELTDGATITPDLANGDQMYVTLDGNRTMANPSNVRAFSTWQMEITQDAVTGSRTLTWGTYYSWSGGTAPTLSTAVDSVDIVTCTVFSDVTKIHSVFHADSK